MPEKKVNVRVVTDVEDEEVDALEKKVAILKSKKIQAKLEADTAELSKVDSRISEIQSELSRLKASPDVDDSEIKKVETELSTLNSKKIDLELSIETAKLKQAEAEVNNLDDSTIDVNVNNISAMGAIDQIGQGFDRLKQGASEVAEQMGTVLESAGKQETNKVFLEHAVGAERAATAFNDINSAVQKLPGDDTVMQGLLSQAVAKDASLTADELNNMGVAAADYFSAMQNYGKSASEAQQDMTNYILAGNTAELERSPVLQGHIDKLKEGTTIQERSKLLQEALNEEHWGGMSQQDTYNNKLETFNGMLERGKYNLGGMFQEGAKWGMDLVMNLDQASGGLVGMGIALGGFASPLTDALMGIGQMATGLKSIKDLGIIQWLKDLELATKAQAFASKIAAAAQWLWNFAVIENPIVIVVIAIIALAAAIIWAYQNVDWFREMVDNAWASLVQIAQVIYSYVMGAIQWLSDLFTNFTSQLGLNTNDWIQAVLGFILFIPTLPLQVGIALVNAIAKVLGFKGNFVQSMISAGANAINGFVSYITQLPGIVMGEFNRVLGLVNDFINSIPQRVWDMGVAIINALKAALGIGSPGHMFYMVEGEFNRIDNLTKRTRFDTASIGQSMVDNFNVDLDANGSTTQNRSSGNNQTINLYIDNVNDEKHIDVIIDRLRRELAWNNQTAGRTV